MQAITGNTYPVRDRLRQLGGRWDAVAKAWVVPDAVAEQARQIVADAPKEESSERKPYRPTKCRVCGARASRYLRIYRNGVCRDCYQDDNW